MREAAAYFPLWMVSESCQRTGAGRLTLALMIAMMPAVWIVSAVQRWFDTALETIQHYMIYAPVSEIQQVVKTQDPRLIEIVSGGAAILIGLSIYVVSQQGVSLVATGGFQLFAMRRSRMLRAMATMVALAHWSTIFALFIQRGAIIRTALLSPVLFLTLLLIFILLTREEERRVRRD